MKWDWLLAYDIVAASCLILTVILWALFFWSTVKKVERKIIESGGRRPYSWDPIGGRAFFYSWTVSLPVSLLKKVDDQQLNIEAVKSYLNRWDRIIGTLFMIVSHTLLVMIIIGVAFGLGEQ